MRDNALIIFSREPEPGKTKTRLMPYYSPEQCAAIHKCFLRDISRAVNIPADIFVYYYGEGYGFLRKTFGEDAIYSAQEGRDIGERMYNALRDVLKEGYKKAVLIGSDIPEIKSSTLIDSFRMLDSYDVVIGPTVDGGYYLIGMKEPQTAPFEHKEYGVGTVFQETLRAIESAGLTACIAEEYYDIDDRSEIRQFRHDMRSDTRMRESATGRFISNNTRISIIIPIYNERNLIQRLLDQLHPSERCEIIFADGGSTDGTLDMIPKEYTVLNCSKGRARQMNEAASVATGDVLFFLHCDSVLPPDYIDEILEVYSVSDYGCFGVVFDRKHFLMLTNRVISNHRAFKRGLPFGDQGIIIDRELFFDVGMFPEIPIMEDYEFGKRMRDLGLYPTPTRNRILTSTRRYGKTGWDILRTEYRMYRLRRLYDSGTDIEDISQMYRDIR